MCRLRTPSTGAPPIASTRNPFRTRGDHQEDCRGAARGGGEVTTVIANPTVGPYGCGGWAIYIGWGGASSYEALTYCGRQSPPERILAGCTIKENPEVLTRDSCDL